MIDINVAADSATVADGAVVYAMQRGQQVRLRFSDDWKDAPILLQFSSGFQTSVLPLLGSTAEIPMPVLISPWRHVTLGIVAVGKAIGPVYCDLGAARPSGATIEGGGSGSVDLSTYATKADLESYATREEINAASAALGDIETRLERDYVTTEDVGILHNFVAEIEGDLQEVQELLETKADASALAGLATQQALADGLASKADTSAIITRTDGDGTQYLGDDGQYHALPSGSAAPDLSAYATTAAVNAALESKAEQSAMAELTAKVNTLDSFTDVLANTLSGKADAADIPDVSGFITADALPDVSGFATQQALADGLAGKADAADIPDVSGFATQQALADGLAGKADAADIPDVSGFATQQALTEGLAAKADAADIPDVTGMATQAWVQEYIASLDGTNIQV